jgi:hypothetical protein
MKYFYIAENRQKDQSVEYILCRKSPKFFGHFAALPSKHSTLFVAGQFIIKITDFIAYGAKSLGY